MSEKLVMKFLVPLINQKRRKDRLNRQSRITQLTFHRLSLVLDDSLPSHSQATPPRTAHKHAFLSRPFTMIRSERGFLRPLLFVSGMATRFRDGALCRTWSFKGPRIILNSHSA
jgi:hypothetical protein